MARLARVAPVLLLALAASAHADVFRILDSPQDAMQARVDVIQQARHDINALYFLARNDRVALTALALLREARRRGVPNVRLIVDANFVHVPKSVLAHLLDEGVQIKVFHPLTLRHPTWVLRRMHDKVIVVDGARYITGGRNLGSAYFGMANRNFVDRDVYVDGPSAAEADRHFETLWSSSHVADLKVRVSPREKERAARRLDEILANTGDFVALNTGRDWSAGERQIANVRFLYDPIGGEGERVAGRIAEIIGGAKTSIVIESPYVIPSKSLLELLEKKVAEGVSVQLLTNSLHSTDGVLPYAGFIKYRRRLVRDGIDVREYKGPDTLHAKSLVIDGRIALIGSYNVDPRSQNLNSEVMCVAEDEEIARALLASIGRHVENAWKIDRGSDDATTGPSAGFRLWAVRVLLVPVLEGQL